MSLCVGGVSCLVSCEKKNKTQKQTTTKKECFIYFGQGNWERFAKYAAEC